MTNSEVALRMGATHLIVTTWVTLSSLLPHAGAAPDTTSNIILGEPLAEKLFINLLDVFCRLGDSQMLGILACLLELDRRSTFVFTSEDPMLTKHPIDVKQARTSPPIRLGRSPGQSGPIDYFNVKPIRAGQDSSPHQGNNDTSRYTPSLLPLKSPKDWLVSTSYGTQNSSSGSRSSSWANNLSTLFRTGTASLAGGKGASTPPVAPGSDGMSPASLSPAFTKRLGPLTQTSEGRRPGGISSNRPRVSMGKSRTTTHVSFASEGGDLVARASESRGPGPARPVKIRIRTYGKTADLKERSLLLGNPNLMRQLEYYKMLYADLLLRLGRVQERNRVLKLTRSAGDGTNSHLMQQACGLAGDDNGIELHMICRRCHAQHFGRSLHYCDKCRRKAQVQLCAFCHLPLNGGTFRFKSVTDD